LDKKHEIEHRSGCRGQRLGVSAETNQPEKWINLKFEGDNRTI